MEKILRRSKSPEKHWNEALKDGQSAGATIAVRRSVFAAKRTENNDLTMFSSNKYILFCYGLFF